MYIVCFVAYQYLDSKFRLPFIFLANIVYIVGCILLKQEIWWYDRVIPFSFGAFFILYKSKIMQVLEKRILRYLILIISLACAFICAYKMSGWGSLYLGWALAFSLFECIFLATFYYIFHFEAAGLGFVGKISFEMFLLHQPIYLLIGAAIANNLVALIISFATSVIVSYILHLLWNKVIVRVKALQKSVDTSLDNQ